MAASTPRKAAARRTPAAARRPKLAAVPAPEPIDILADFGTDEKPPVPIRLGKIEADVRRGFSGEEVVDFHKLLLNNEFEQLFEMITDRGAEIWDYISKLDPRHASKAINRIVEVSEIHEGEATAPLLGYMPDPAGAQPSPESSATTG